MPRKRSSNPGERAVPSGRLVLATRNADKIREIKEILGLRDGELRSLLDYPEMRDIEENGSTLEQNALIKAAEGFRMTEMPCLADDTGLEVDSLNGEPGVYSSRYAGENATYADNVRKLLVVMKDVPPEKRSARFRCVVALKAEGREEWVDGTCEGVILKEPRGSGGFGYDPVFFVTEIGKTLAEMSPADKNAISHRGRAFRKMAEVLKRNPV
jgi:XTP/dITP diphosphohydrolase